MKTKRQRDKRRYIVKRIILTLLVIINLLLITSLIAHEINADSYNRLYTINVPSPRISPNIAISPTPSPTPKSTPSPSPTSMNISHKPGYITHSGVNVRQAANIQSDIITTLDMGTRVEIIEADKEWTKCWYNEKIVYVANKFITEDKPKPTPAPTPRYGKWTREDYLLLSTLIYCEASRQGGLPEAVAVGWVVRNRLEDVEEWGDKTWYDVISRGNGKQFTVFSKNRKSKFQRTLKEISQTKNPQMKIAKRAARFVMQDRETHKIPKEIQFFCSINYYNSVKKSNGNWGKHKFYKQIGKTAFFYK